MLKLDVYMQLSFTLSLLCKTYIHLRYALSNVHLLLQKDVQLILSRPSCWASPWEPFPPKIGNSKALAIFWLQPKGKKEALGTFWLRPSFSWQNFSLSKAFRLDSTWPAKASCNSNTLKTCLMFKGNLIFLTLDKKLSIQIFIWWSIPGSRWVPILP